MTSSLKPFCVMKQGRYQWSSWSQRIVTVDTETGSIWISKKNREDMPHYHKLVYLELQPWLMYKEKYIDEDVRTKEAMLSVRLKGYEAPASQDEKFEVQRLLLDGTAPASTQVDASSFGYASPPASALAPSVASRTSTRTPSSVAKEDIVDCVLRFTSADSLLDFTNAIVQLHLRRGDKDGAAQVVSGRDRAIVAIEQLAVKEDRRNNFTDLM